MISTHPDPLGRAPPEQLTLDLTDKDEDTFDDWIRSLPRTPQSRGDQRFPPTPTTTESTTRRPRRM